MDIAGPNGSAGFGRRGGGAHLAAGPATQGDGLTGGLATQATQSVGPSSEATFGAPYSQVLGCDWRRTRPSLDDFECEGSVETDSAHCFVIGVRRKAALCACTTLAPADATWSRKHKP